MKRAENLYAASSAATRMDALPPMHFNGGISRTDAWIEVSRHRIRGEGADSFRPTRDTAMLLPSQRLAYGEGAS